MSKDGYLPDNVSEKDFDRAFPPDCPDDCASMRSCPMDCGGCSCHVNPPCPHCEQHEPGECDCAERAAAAKADAAEAQRDREMDR